MLAKGTLSYWISQPRTLTAVPTRPNSSKRHLVAMMQASGPLFRTRRVQESVKMSATEIAVFLEGLEQAVKSADLEAGIGSCNCEPT